MRNNKGQFIKGFSASPKTQFKKGNHWRSHKPYWDKDWLIHEYINLQKSAKEIAENMGCKENNILYFLKKHEIPTRQMVDIRAIKYWGVSGEDNPMCGKTGEQNPNWLGGVTPERQAFYLSQEWKSACSSVWARDKATCQRCDIKASSELTFHIHHIVSFSSKELRGDINNLVLLCESCHHFVHSNKNIEKDFIRKEVIKGGDR